MDCIFCEIIAGREPGHMLLAGKHVCSFLSLEGHPLVVPFKHVSGLEDLDDETCAEILQTAKRLAIAVRAATECEGINLVLSDGAAAGQDVFHLHLHVKPRWAGDTATFQWDTRAMPSDARTELSASIRSHLCAKTKS